jgi:Domain of unknown function (DUF4338)
MTSGPRGDARSPHTLTIPATEADSTDSAMVESDRELLRRQLKSRVLESLASQGLDVQRGRCTAGAVDKVAVRALHRQARAAWISRAWPALERHEGRLIQRFAAGSEVQPDRIAPRLVEVTRHSEAELLFRYARLTWSIPVSPGYGRRLRYLVMDQHNGKLIGLFGLGDPVFALTSRDQWIGWDVSARRARLRHVVDAFTLGAVPPYASLLCGKLVAMLATSTEVQHAFERKYRGQQSRISRQSFDGRLALLTTTSALGRSSLYNRLTFDGRPLYQRAGWTCGSGEFHFSNGLYSDLVAYAQEYCKPSAKQAAWGNGWRNRREVVRRVLSDLGLSQDLLYHGVEREVFVAPLATNARPFLQGNQEQLERGGASAQELFTYFRTRWLLPRARRTASYRDFDPASLRLGPQDGIDGR